MRKKVSKTSILMIMMIAWIFVTLCGSNVVYASESANVENVCTENDNFDVEGMVDSSYRELDLDYNINISDTEVIATMNNQLAEAMDDNRTYDFSDITMSAFDEELEDIAGDSYEANNGPSVATTGRYNSITYATIHDDNDVDWYKIEILNADTPISIVLTNIPNNCDYDLYLIQYDDTNGITAMYQNAQTGTTSEELYGYVNDIGTYYVIVQPNTSLVNNYSSSNYKLYIGNYFRTGSLGWEDTGIDINFGYHPTGNTTPSYSSWYSYNLANRATIPNGAIVNQFYLDNNGNGAYWAGFYKTLMAAGQGIRLDDTLGGITLVYSGDDEYLVKQQWLIGGYVTVSYSFIWEPRALITYKFPATLQNLSYL